jgi:nicotinamide mononucleotide (NMN) deamidase PncC
LLSPGGEDRVPVGTVCMAVADQDRVVAKTFRFHMDRLRNKELAVHNGLLMIWRFLHQKI